MAYDAEAETDIRRSLGLCDTYALSDVSDTAHRRMGRLLHDIALRETNPKIKIDLLDQALGEFEHGLLAAVDTRDTLEELESLTEIAFLADEPWRL